MKGESETEEGAETENKQQGGTMWGHCRHSPRVVPRARCLRNVALKPNRDN